MELPADVEAYLREKAKSEFRSFGKELSRRIVQSVLREQEEAQHEKQA